MAMTAVSMKNRRKAAQDAVPLPTENTAEAARAYREALLLADSQAIIDEIQANAVVNTTVTIPSCNYSGGHPGGTGTGTVS